METPPKPRSTRLSVEDLPVEVIAKNIFKYLSPTAVYQLSKVPEFASKVTSAMVYKGQFHLDIDDYVEALDLVEKDEYGYNAVPTGVDYEAILCPWANLLHSVNLKDIRVKDPEIVLQTLLSFVKKPSELKCRLFSHDLGSAFRQITLLSQFSHLRKLSLYGRVKELEGRLIEMLSGFAHLESLTLDWMTPGIWNSLPDSLLHFTTSGLFGDAVKSNLQSLYFNGSSGPLPLSVIAPNLLKLATCGYNLSPLLEQIPPTVKEWCLRSDYLRKLDGKQFPQISSLDIECWESAGSVCIGAIFPNLKLLRLTQFSFEYRNILKKMELEMVTVELKAEEDEDYNRIGKVDEILFGPLTISYQDDPNVEDKDLTQAVQRRFGDCCRCFQDPKDGRVKILISPRP